MTEGADSVVDAFSAAAGRTLSPSEIRDAIAEGIAVVAQLPIKQVNAELRLAELGLDSIGVTEVLLEVEEQLGAELPVEVLDRLDEAAEVVTLQDLYALLGVA